MLLRFLIQTNLFIALAAVSLALETLVLLGQPLQWHPYHFLIFFATLCEYNLHRFVTVVFHRKAQTSDKHAWARKHKGTFYVLVALSVLGFCVAALLAEKAVLLVLAPFALLTFFYSIPFWKKGNRWYRLRDVPFFKIVLIALVWSGATVMLPAVKADLAIGGQVMGALVARFFFIVGITVPFDIRDRNADQDAGLFTIPTFFSEALSYRIAYGCILVFIGLSGFLYHNVPVIAFPLVASGAISLAVLRWPAIRSVRHYHYGILDGMMLLQAMLVVGVPLLF